MGNKNKTGDKQIKTNLKSEKYQDMYFRLVENAKDMIYRMSLPDGSYEYVSSASVKIFGYKPEVFYKTPALIREAIHPDFSEFFQKEWENLLNDNMPETYEYKIIHKSGEERWLNQRNVMVQDEKGKPIAIEGIVTDITERKKVEFERDNLAHKIGERYKELNCLYKISDYSLEEITIREFIKKVIDIIPPSFQYPEITEVKITLESKEYKSKKYKPSKWFLKHDIIIASEKIGEIEINYQDEMPKHDRGPFLKEELNLINGIAELVGKVIESRNKDLLFQEKNEEYSTINEELKEKNEEYQSLYEEYLSQNEELQEQNEEYHVINEKLKSSHENQLAFFDGIEDVIYVADPDTYELLFFNETARNIWGKDSIGKKCYKVLQERDKPCPFCSNDKIFGENLGKRYVWEFQNEVSKQWFRCADKAIKWSNGKMVRFELASDISELKNTQTELVENKNRLQALLDSVPTGIVLIDKETRKIEEANPYALKIMGRSEQEVLNKKCNKYFCQSDDHQCPICDLHQEVDLSERAINLKNGQTIPIIKSVVQININGKEKLLESFIDISERKETELKLHESQERLSLALEGSNDGLWDWNLVTNEVYFSINWKKIIGYKDEELVNSFDTWEELVHPEDIALAKKVIDDYLKGKIKKFESEFRMKHKKGHFVNILSRGTVTTNKNGEKDRFTGTHVDVSELRRVEKELRKEKDLIERYFSLVEALIVILDKNGNITKINRKACEILGYKEKELVGKNWFKTCLPQPEGFEMVYPVFKQIISGKMEGAEYFENEILTKNGEKLYIAWHNNYMADSKNKVTGVISAGEDITIKRIQEEQLKNLNDELLRSNKELEQFAYVASHDLQEPLRKVKTFAELFANKYQGNLDEKADRYLEYMTSGAARMQILIMDLLEFSRVATRGKEFIETELNKLVKTVLDDLQITIKENNAELEIQDLPSIKADESQLKQVFQNLISNAIKFKSNKNPIIKISAKSKNTHWQFCVADNGIGIEMQYAQRIFEVFQRLHTKEEYKGTGIGLAICKKITERHKGKIWIESEPGNGTKFYFTINNNLTNNQKN